MNGTTASWGTGASPVFFHQGKHGRGANATLNVVIAFFLLCVLRAAALYSAEPVRFAAIDVFIDPQAQPLAAYQFELTAPATVKLVGVEGGEHPAFAKAPYYDARALQQHRIVIAGLSTDTSLPTGKTRVARVHVQISGNSDPDFTVKLIVAGDRDAKAIANASATYAPVETQKKEQ